MSCCLVRLDRHGNAQMSFAAPVTWGILDQGIEVTLDAAMGRSLAQMVKGCPTLIPRFQPDKL
jgi:hypothetical protein